MSFLTRDRIRLAVLALFVQAYQIFKLGKDPTVTGPIIDAFDFHREAARIASGAAPPQYPNFHPPYFEWLLSVVYRIFGSKPENGLFLQALIVLVLVWEIHALALRWMEERP